MTKCVIDTHWSTVFISWFASPKCEMDTCAQVALLHAETALPSWGNNTFKATKSVVSKNI